MNCLHFLMFLKQLAHKAMGSVKSRSVSTQIKSASSLKSKCLPRSTNSQRSLDHRSLPLVTLTLISFSLAQFYSNSLPCSSVLQVWSGPPMFFLLLCSTISVVSNPAGCLHCGVCL
jgi:hypothetical protein